MRSLLLLCITSTIPWWPQIFSPLPCRWAGIECINKIKKWWCLFMPLCGFSTPWVVYWLFHLALSILCKKRLEYFESYDLDDLCSHPAQNILHSVNLTSRVQTNPLNFEGDESWEGNEFVYFVLESCLYPWVYQETFLQICSAVRTDAKRPCNSLRRESN